jgi:hypothetical protein
MNDLTNYVIFFLLSIITFSALVIVLGGLVVFLAMQTA